VSLAYVIELEQENLQLKARIAELEKYEKLEDTIYGAMGEVIALKNRNAKLEHVVIQAELFNNEFRKWYFEEQRGLPRLGLLSAYLQREIKDYEENYIKNIPTDKTR
jgi:hypothetical protein